MSWAWPPTDEAKRAHLLALFFARHHEIFVECGTHIGGTVQFFQEYAKAIASVEINPETHAKLLEAQRAGLIRNEAWLVCGDGTEWIPRLARQSPTPPLVWLDGHHSGGDTGRGVEDEPALTILRKLGEVAAPGTTIAVDDLRLFGSLAGWPTLDKLVGAAQLAFPRARIYCAVDALVVEA